MGREIRRVISSWEHPQNEQGTYIPLFDGSHAALAAQWDADEAHWNSGLRPQYYPGHPEIDLANAIRVHGLDSAMRTRWVPAADLGHAPSSDTWTDYADERPRVEDYRPDWPDADATWVQLYETVSEGTPVSPAFATLPELRAWLLAHGDYWSSTPPSEASLDLLIHHGVAPSFIVRGGYVAPWQKQAEGLIYGSARDDGSVRTGSCR